MGGTGVQGVSVPGVSKADTPRRIRKRLARRLRVGVAVALLGLAGCTENTGPAEAKSAKTQSAKSAAAIEVKLTSLGGVSADDTQRLAALIEERAALPGMPFASDTRHKYAIAGAVDAGPAPAGTYFVAVLDVRDSGGAQLHRIVEDALIEGTRGMALSPADLAQLARDAVAKLAAWHMASFGGNGAGGQTMAALAPGDLGPDETLAGSRVGNMGTDDDFATGSIARLADATTPGARLHFDIDMAPAPGDGREALASALGEALSRRAPTSQWNEGRYLLRGEVALAGTATGDTGLSIRWQVMTEDGQLLGTVTQVSATGPASVAHHWGPLAGDAAEAAASGVLAVLARPAGGA